MFFAPSSRGEAMEGRSPSMPGGPGGRPPRHNRAVRVAILGPLEVHDDGGAAIAVAGARLRGLIARLALAGGQPVSTGALADAVWDCAPPADVANALQTLVSRARRALGGAAAVEQSAAGYRLAVEPDDVDALRFERLVAEGAVAEALALWRGPALADAGDFAEPFARRLEELRLEATVTFLTREIDAGRAAARAGELESLVAEHPLHEQLTGLLMRALAAAGRQADALAAYEALRNRLADELGIDPGLPLRAVHLEVLRGEIAVAPAPRDRARTNLRAQLTSFVGRQDEVVRVRQALEQLPARHAGRPRWRGQDAAGRRGGRRSAGRRDRRRARRDLAGRARVGHRRRRRAAGGARLGRPAGITPAARRDAAGHQPRRAHPAARGTRRRPRPARPRQLRAPHRRVRPPGGRAARAQPAAADRRDEQGAARHHRGVAVRRPAP